MRIAIFSDVHGNSHALEAVLAHIDGNGTFDHIVFAGDLVSGGGNPAACINILEARDIPGVCGNTDARLWDKDYLPQGVSPEVTKQKTELSEWTRQKIGEFGLAYLQALPNMLRYSPTHRSEDDLLVVHANPKDMRIPIFRAESAQFDEKGRIIQADNEVRQLLIGVTAKTIAFGHYHWPNVRRVDDYVLVNTGSVSQPFDGDVRAKYVVLSFEKDKWLIEHRFVPYDVEAARMAILKSGMPHAQLMAEELAP